MLLYNKINSEVIVINIYEAKLKHYNLNLFYPREENNISAETNLLIQHLFNYFSTLVKDYQYFILEYHDDIISSICYRLLKAFSIYNEINIFIYGKKKKTKKFLVKKQKRISFYKVKKLLKNEKTLYISPFNPLYEVTKSKEKFKHFDTNIWYPMKQFTYDNLLIAREFYHIGYLKNDLIENELCKDFNNWCTNQKNFYTESWADYSKLVPAQDNFDSLIYFLELSDDLEKNNKLLQKMQDKDGLFFYSYKNEKIDCESQLYKQLIAFSYYLKNNSNTIGYGNNTNFDIVKEFSNYLNCQIVIEYADKE